MPAIAYYNSRTAGILILLHAGYPHTCECILRTAICAFFQMYIGLFSFLGQGLSRVIIHLLPLQMCILQPLWLIPALSLLLRLKLKKHNAFLILFQFFRAKWGKLPFFYISYSYKVNIKIAAGLHLFYKNYFSLRRN